MVTTQEFRCVVVLAEAETDSMARPTQPRFRPSDLLPWADPHIRSLVEQLQDEVRSEEPLPANDLLNETAMVEDLVSEIEAQRIREGDARLAADLWSDEPMAPWYSDTRRF
ncbi:MAG: hypothetical protein AAF266_07320 [Planctomycetota bacterium]